MGAHPYPLMVRNFQRIIGDEAREQIQKKEARLPDMPHRLRWGGSNAMGLFFHFSRMQSVKMVGVEAGRRRHSGGPARRAFSGRFARSVARTRSFLCRMNMVKSNLRTAFRPA